MYRDMGEINPIKCYILSTAKGFKPHFYQLNCHILETVKTNPYLGVVLSDDLFLTALISTITKIANGMLGIIRRNI